MKRITHLTLLGWLLTAIPSLACTGITLRSAQGETVAARTIEWAGNDLNSQYVIVPRGHKHQSFLPDGRQAGKSFTARYGYVGLAVEQADFVVDGLNEAGLSAGLFYFPGYGAYEPFRPEESESSLADLQLVSWVLASFQRIDEMKEAIRHLHVIGIDPRSSTVHWRITEEGGRQVVLEIVEGEIRFYENALGVLTNAPGFDWHLTNLNNYINLSTGSVGERNVGALTLKAFGGGSGLHGIPGDMSPTSRFIRAAFFQATAPVLPHAQAVVMQAFHLLNNFDIPIGIQFASGQELPDIPSATQWTIATDLVNRRIYYRTMYDGNIRCIDLNTIRFGKVRYQSAPLDAERHQTVVMVRPQ